MGQRRRETKAARHASQGREHFKMTADITENSAKEVRIEIEI